ncbi:MAG: glycoside hydrolase family 3 [Desulfobulbus propionicus]|nr:MAG: glycoside hydrolase family 3 [Desulfobulbus propionicus]
MKTGQMFLAGFTGTRLTDGHWLYRVVERHGLGGVVLFDRTVGGARQNIASPGQLQKLCTELRVLEPNLLVAVDQEGGQVRRLKHEDGFAQSRSAQALGRETVERVYRYYRGMARELANVGVNCNLAPVVDLDRNPNNPIIGRFGRSFSADARHVTACARVCIQAHHEAGVGCCLKHFPGHGSATGDTHLGLVDVSNDWVAEELVPFTTLIRQGYRDAIMTAHVVHSGLDAKHLPATLSPEVVQGLLRDTLGFNGVIISDDLQMQAISSQWGYRQAVQMAVLAGVDLLIVGNNLSPREDAVDEGVAAITELLDSGRLAPERVAASLARINSFQQRCRGEELWNSMPPTIS